MNLHGGSPISMAEPQPSLGLVSQARPAESAWGPLREPLFRTLWIASVASYVGTWMQNMGTGWLMASLTASPMMVGLVQAATTLPVFLVILPAGALADKKFWEHRQRSINDLEKHLHRNGTRVVKFFLHLSKDEQRRRFLARIDDPEKNWKFSQADLAERKFWKAYMKAY